jgi:hypothetical protein
MPACRFQDTIRGRTGTLYRLPRCVFAFAARTRKMDALLQAGMAITGSGVKGRAYVLRIDGDWSNLKPVKK